MLRETTCLATAAFLLSLGFSSVGSAVTVRRISRIYVDMSKPSPLFMIPRMGTVLTLPCAIQEMVPGSSDFKVETSKVDPKRASLKLTSSQSEATDLTIHCTNNQSMTFDIIANSEIHQSQVIVQGLYGTPEMGDTHVIATERQGTSGSSPAIKNSTILFQLPAVEGVTQTSSPKGKEKTSYAKSS